MTKPIYTSKQLEHVLVIGGQALLEILKRQGDAVRCTCVECINFDHKAEVCVLAGVRPPAHVIAYGCPQYCDDIPF